MPSYLLAHLSDPHLAPMPRPRWHELLGKRALGYINWRRNRHQLHRRECLDALVADLHAQNADHIALTGDLVNIALPAEFNQASRWVSSLGSPHDVTIVPGNHDIYVRAAPSLMGAAVGEYMRGDGQPADAPLQFPFVRRRGPVTLIGVSSGVPTLPFMAIGYLGTPQRARLETLLAETADEDRFRVLLIHHPLHSTPARHAKRLTDSAELIAILQRHRIDVVLHGHDHRHALVWIDSATGRTPVIGVPSASAARHEGREAASYHLFDIARDDNGGWRCEIRIRGLNSAEGFSETGRTKLA